MRDAGLAESEGLLARLQQLSAGKRHLVFLVVLAFQRRALLTRLCPGSISSARRCSATGGTSAAAKHASEAIAAGIATHCGEPAHGNPPPQTIGHPATGGRQQAQKAERIGNKAVSYTHLTLPTKA